MAGKRVVTIVCDSGERYVSLPFFCTMSRWKRRGQRRCARTSPPRATATPRRRASRPSRSSPAGPGCRRCSPTALAHALLEAGVPIAPRVLAYLTPLGDRGRDPPGGEDRRRVLHRPRLRRRDRRDRRDRRAGDPLPGGDAGRHRLPARQAPPDPRRQRHRRLRRQAARPDRGRRRRQDRRQHGRRRGRAAARDRGRQPRPPGQGRRQARSRAPTPTGSTCPTRSPRRSRRSRSGSPSSSGASPSSTAATAPGGDGDASCAPRTGRSSAGG